MKVLIAGSREFNNYALLHQELSKFTKPITEIISGTARGADTMGEHYANLNNIPIKKFPANWDRYGKKAGYIRNVDMGEYCDCAVIFWNGKSKGTKHMIDILNEKKKPYYIVYFKEE